MGLVCYIYNVREINQLQKFFDILISQNNKVASVLAPEGVMSRSDA